MTSRACDALNSKNSVASKASFGRQSMPKKSASTRSLEYRSSFSSVSSRILKCFFNFLASFSTMNGRIVRIACKFSCVRLISGGVPLLIISSFL